MSGAGGMGTRGSRKGNSGSGGGNAGGSSGGTSGSIKAMKSRHLEALGPAQLGVTAAAAPPPMNYSSLGLCRHLEALGPAQLGVTNQLHAAIEGALVEQHWHAACGGCKAQMAGMERKKHGMAWHGMVQHCASWHGMS